MKNERDLKDKHQSPAARSDEKTIRHETIPGKDNRGTNADKQSNKEKASQSTADDDLN